MRKMSKTQIMKAAPEEIIQEFNLEYAEQDGTAMVHIRGSKPGKQQIEALKARKPDIISILIAQKEERERAEVERKAREAAARQAADDNLNNETIVNVWYGYGYMQFTYGVSAEIGNGSKIEAIKKRLNTCEAEGVKYGDRFDDYLDSVDYGEYSDTYHWKLTVGQLVAIIEEMEKIVAEKKAKREAKEAAREAERAAMKVTILKQGKVRGSDGYDTYAHVEITDGEETLQFNCRNIFDFGYVINPAYAVMPGTEGGIAIEGRWSVSKGEGRELTEFEKKALAYLRKFPPVSSGIRM